VQLALLFDLLVNKFWSLEDQRVTYVEADEKENLLTNKPM